MSSSLLADQGGSEVPYNCHVSGCGHPFAWLRRWIPTFTGITNQLLVLTLEKRDWQATANRFCKFMLQSLLTMKARFIGEQISVEWDKPPFLEKKPTCPDRLIWSGENLQVALKLAEWRDYQRRGRMETNMRPEHRQRARQRGSWGVGRFYFRVLVTDGRTFELYYDRAAKGSDQRKGSWFLSQELL